MIRETACAEYPRRGDCLGTGIDGVFCLRRILGAVRHVVPSQQIEVALTGLGMPTDNNRVLRRGDVPGRCDVGQHVHRAEEARDELRRLGAGVSAAHWVRSDPVPKTRHHGMPSRTSLELCQCCVIAAKEASGGVRERHLQRPRTCRAHALQAWRGMGRADLAAERQHTDHHAAPVIQGRRHKCGAGCCG
jgi:hypothetical protein